MTASWPGNVRQLVNVIEQCVALTTAPVARCMAPLSGLETHPLAPLWHRMGPLLYRHGEHFYNFQGLRSYKAKFDPQWHAKYLVAPGGVGMPAVLLDVAALIAGGYRGIVLR